MLLRTHRVKRNVGRGTPTNNYLVVSFHYVRPSHLEFTRCFSYSLRADLRRSGVTVNKISIERTQRAEFSSLFDFVNKEKDHQSVVYSDGLVLF